MSVTSEDPYQPLAPIGGGYHPLHGYADDGLLGYQEAPADATCAKAETAAAAVEPSQPAETTLERLLHRRRLSSRRAPGEARSS